MCYKMFHSLIHGLPKSYTLTFQNYFHTAIDRHEKMSISTDLSFQRWKRLQRTWPCPASNWCKRILRCTEHFAVLKSRLSWKQPGKHSFRLVANKGCSKSGIPAGKWNAVSVSWERNKYSNSKNEKKIDI